MMPMDFDDELIAILTNVNNYLGISNGKGQPVTDAEPLILVVYANPFLEFFYGRLIPEDERSNTYVSAVIGRCYAGRAHIYYF